MQGQRNLYKLIAKNFNLEELDELAFELGLSIEELGGSSLTSKARELQTYMTRRSRTDDLVAAIARARPKLDWSEYGLTDVSVPGQAAASSATTQTTSYITKSPAQTADSEPLSAPTPRFENFDLRIGMMSTDGRYPIEVLRSPTGESQTEWQTMPLDDSKFTDLVAYLQSLYATDQDAVELGRKMRQLLFPGPVWNAFDRSRAVMKERGMGLRIRLRIDPPELSHLPWEYCYDDSYRYFALQRETPMVRYVAKPFAPDTLLAPNPMKILLAISAPSDQKPLSIEEEAGRVSSILKLMGDRVQLKILRNATPEQLHGALAERPHVLHFIGHGVMQKGRGSLVFEDLYGRSQLLDAEQLMFLLGDTGVKVVILNACKSASHDARDALLGVAPALVHAEIPAVIAMQFNVPDATALGFTRDLYRFLVAGYPLDAAVTEMRLGAFLSANDKFFWGIPVLYMRAQDGMLWQPDEEVLKLFAKAQAEAAEAGGPDIAHLLQELEKQISTIEGDLDPRDFKYIQRDLAELKELVKEENPRVSYILRALAGIQDGLEESDVPAVKAIMPLVKRMGVQAKKQYST